ncbi:hypothetical protein ACFO1B_15275 [Dactylosporangium siamense]|uniref:Uncharacterized protein n=1 Tax=Dactylosporangium siamense TaxID=685454 RepID=A0A919PKH7_9ACTN|nr:hypothetical protein [Dactylosporangium siamense]GIG45197.1 hypothetical protein Dsi01nite_032380 [Dactylosporangium siamense]
MSGPQRSGGGMGRWLPINGEPAGWEPDEICFVDDPTAATGWGRAYPAGFPVAGVTGEWAATAWAALDAVGGAAAAVVGAGALAGLLRLAVAFPADPRPAAVIETTGTTEGVELALRTVAPCGTVVLAARPLWPTAALRTYHDVHRSGVRILPVPWAPADPRAAPLAAAGPGPVRWPSPIPEER